MTYIENNVKLILESEYKTPKDAEVYFNPRMSFNRELTLAALRSIAFKSDKSIECLDAFAASGVCALQWKINLNEKVAVYAADIRDQCITRIKENCSLNDINSSELSINDINYGEKCLGRIKGVSVIKCNADIVMRMQGFDFIHMDPYGSTAPHLESAMKNIRNDGILVLTSTDVASLLSRNAETVLRNYGAKVIKTQYKKELAVRTILVATAQAAAKCNKGIKVLLTVVEMNFVFVAVKIERGSKKADQSLLNVSDLLHCRVCEDRCWYKSGQMAPVTDPYKTLLTCDCHLKNSGKTAVKIGPFWSGGIFDYDFVCELIQEMESENYSQIFKTTLKSIKKEMDVFLVPNKIEFPSFYYFPQYLNILCQIPRMEEIVEHFKEKGFLVSRTYIDSTAIRTNARMNQIIEVLQACSNIQE